MKKNVSLFFVITIVSIFTSGCVGPRTASIGYKYVPPVITTNMVGTTTRQQVDGQPGTTTTTTNWSVISTPPIEKRTWKEVVLGKRAPGATVQSVVPPFPGEIPSPRPAQIASLRKVPFGYYRGSGGYGYGGSVRLYGGRENLGRPNPRANLQKGSGGVLGQPNPRANIPRYGGGRESLGRPNPRANLWR